MIGVPKALLWDYVEPPPDLPWRLQRIADFFPHYGRDRETVQLFYAQRDDLNPDVATGLLIEQYYRNWQAQP